MNTKNVLIGLSIITFLSAFALVPQDKKPWEIPSKYKSMKNPYTDDLEDLVDYGADLYSKHCASCHGDDGIGDGSKADELKTYPGDFTSDEFKAYSDGEMYYMSIIGRDEMPNYEKKITDEEGRWAVIEYIKSF